ncbi:phenylalanine--tRNA ligase subunit beta [Corynebacterium canis]|uniref:Phenylalanine--tRNA ligase beta subunit n=1 Tax=Corynebacterium canis TaxID=679663 RepID=A0A5C5U4T3_9CORY|nr:phenylalanine--tRNA ligase subunit beta [Corynebacterium canis]TWT21006.1 phenylalanine--tRNA ligase subunit beta [Corynebacterium canis]WJY75149.1 Phenylalanine--tRNA ligase beta subunit [Corynebacterium canis]
MFIAQSWLTGLLQRANPGWSVTPEELDAGFIRVGFETEGYAPLPETTGPLVIGRVESIEELTEFKKPIRHCMVNVGDANGTGELQSIICGARNFTEGSTVVVCLPGTVLPGGFAISARETYGRMSAGMICSAAELGMTEKQNAGIITLDASVGEPGTDARAILGLDDTVFEVNITPDRGYALSLRGLARELASAFELDFIDPAAQRVDLPTNSAAELIPVTLGAETKARRFGLRSVTGVDPQAETPFWMQRELMLCGQRPVNLPTDITNYVMLLLGQPMHAFDADKISGGLVVRNARAGETLVTLDDATRVLDEGDVVICDDQGIQSLAGVMGGSTSEISDATVNVFFEAANWDPITVARTSRRHKLSSEASRRFERGVDPAVVEVALDLACSLLVEYGGGTIAAERTLVGKVPAMPTITMSAARPGDIAGVEYSRETVIGRLEEVGCEVAVLGCGCKLEVTPPTWRSDLTMTADLVEEVLRLEGLEDIPSIVPTAPAGRGLSAAQLRRRAIGHALAYGGYAEILPTPFISNDVFDVWGLDADDERRRVVTVQNPLEADRGVLGTTLLPSMLDALKRNVARGHKDVHLFGVQQVSVARGTGISPMPSVAQRPDEDAVSELLDSLPIQPLHVATVGCGHWELEGPWGEGRAYSFADAIESARVVARAADVELTVANAEKLPWHPGRCAALFVGDVIVGYAGELHPQVVERAGLPPRTCAMEINVAALPFAPSLPAPVLSAFPALLQDLALVVAEDVPAEAVRSAVEQGAGDLLEDVQLFDIYRADSLGEGKKSLAFSLRFRAPDRTLTDEECNTARLAAAEAARVACGAEMR